MPKLVLAKGWTPPTSFQGPVPAVPAEQLGLFPRKTQIEFPLPDGKDIFSYVQADNGRSYYLKLDKGDIPVRANEWLATRLAELVGIVTPRADFIQTFSGDIAFGSEEISGVSKKVDTVIYLETRTLNELGSAIPGLQSALSSIHAFDMFINNVDRHLGNFLVRADGDRSNLIAVDFARSFFWRWPWDRFPEPSDKTCEAWSDLRDRHGFDITSALAIADRLGIINEAQVAGLVDQMPAHWLTSARRDELLAYCREGHWVARVELLRKGLVNGTIV